MRPTLRALIALAGLVGIGLVVDSLGLTAHLDAHWVDAEVRDGGLHGEILFFVAAVLATAVGAPRQFLSFLAGYGFGFLHGTLLIIAATVAGALLAFGYARWLARPALAQRLSDRLVAADHALSRHTFGSVLAIRLFPVGSNLLTNLLAGLSHARLAPFLIASALGYLPQSAIFALAGSGIETDPVLRSAVAALLLLASSAIGYHLYRRWSLARARLTASLDESC
jgi:uncharacterized membrane protein YdjX (TVP38/TMEM64 family)